MSLKGRTLLITGASRGIGKAIALRAARDGANIIVAAKTTEEHPKLEGTIFTAAAEIESAGGRALAVQCDIRDYEQIEKAVQAGVQKFGRLDIVVCNASAINLQDTLSLPVKSYDLMHAINARGTYMTCRAALPHLLATAKKDKAARPHILTLSPPLNIDGKHFKGHVAYTMAKYAMSMVMLGLAEEFKGRVAVNALWPRTMIATAAVRNLLGGDESVRLSRTPDIMADAAHAIFLQPISYSGKFLIDEDVLIGQGVSKEQLLAYAVDREAASKGQLITDLFLDEPSGGPIPVGKAKL